MAGIRDDVAPCSGGRSIALPTHLIVPGTYSCARCVACGAKVAVWFEAGEWYLSDHLAGASTDEEGLASLPATGVRGAAISFD